MGTSTTAAMTSLVLRVNVNFTPGNLPGNSPTQLICLVLLRFVWHEPTLLVVRQRVGVVERAGMEPHARRPECPGVTHGAREQMLAEADADRVRGKPEVGDLHRVVLRNASQLVPPRQRAAAAGHVQRDLGLRRCARISASVQSQRSRQWYASPTVR